MRDAIKGFFSWTASALWWIVDHTYGDAVYGLVKPMIPAEILSPSSEYLWRVALSYGPPLALFLLGSYFVYRSLKAGSVEPRSSAIAGRQLRVVQGPGSAYSEGQTGGITAGTVTFENKARRLDQALKDEIMRICKDKPSWKVIVPLGDHEAFHLGNDIKEFMIASGIDMRKDPLEHRFGLIAKGLIVYDTNNGWDFVVGSNL